MCYPWPEWTKEEWAAQLNEPLEKARVKQHTRKMKTGKLTIVKEHQRKDQPAAQEEHLILPPEPGTIPLPAGKIRGYHYTKHLAQVLREGLDVSHARGATYGEPNGIWFSTEKPGSQKDYVEVFIDPSEIRLNGPDLYPYQGQSPAQRLADYNAGSHDFILNSQNIDPSRFVTHHSAWHETARYLLKDPEHYPMTQQTIKDLELLRDTLPGTPQATAINFWIARAKETITTRRGT